MKTAYLLRPARDLTLVSWIALGSCFASGDALQGDLRAHDPSSIITHGDSHYIFTTGWGLRTKRSPDLLTWEDGPTVFSRGAAPEWTSRIVPGFRGHFWAPDLIKINDAYWLYYSVSRFGKQTSAIGLATNTTLDPNDSAYAWRDAGVVISSKEGDPYNAIDPSVLLDKKSRLWMAFGSYWDGIFLIELNPTSGLCLQEQPRPTRLASAKSIEAATLLERGDYYYLFFNQGTCCRGVDSTYRIYVGRSDRVTGPYRDREGRLLTEGGGTLLLDSEGARIGPGHVAPLNPPSAKQFGFHYYDGNDRGKSKLAMASWEWSKTDWPIATNIELASNNNRGRTAPAARDSTR